MTTSLLLTNGYIHSVSEPYANALHADNGVIAWLGSDEAGEQLVAATVSGPVENRDLNGALITPAFMDGFSSSPIIAGDTRASLSSTTPMAHGVYYAPLGTDAEDADGIFLTVDQLEQLPEVLADIQPPTQLLLQTQDPNQLDHVLDMLAKEKNTTLMRSRHRILANHPMISEQISKLMAVHASVTVVPEIVEHTPLIHAPVASLIAAGVHVATGTGDWSGSVWDMVTALIEHPDSDQRVSTRAAFNTMARDGVRVVPSRIAQANMGAGHIAVGSPADFNVWQADQLGVQAPDVKAAHWSTDKRAGTALLPILSSTEHPPQLQLTIRNGQII